MFYLRWMMGDDWWLCLIFTKLPIRLFRIWFIYKYCYLFSYFKITTTFFFNKKSYDDTWFLFEMFDGWRLNVFYLIYDWELIFFESFPIQLLHLFHIFKSPLRFSVIEILVVIYIIKIYYYSSFPSGSTTACGSSPSQYRQWYWVFLGSVSVKH